MDVLIITNATLRGEALSGLLAASTELIATSCSYEERRSASGRGASYDVIVCDAADAAKLALSAIASLVREAPDRPIVAVMAADDDRSCEYFDCGAAGVVRWDSSNEELRASIREVASGHHYASRAVLRGLIGAADRSSSTANRRRLFVDGLTAKEQSIVDLLLRGMTNQEIAKSLFLAEPTVKAHLGRIMTKWGVRDRLQVVLKAMNASYETHREVDPKVAEI